MKLTPTRRLILGALADGLTLTRNTSTLAGTRRNYIRQSDGELLVVNEPTYQWLLTNNLLTTIRREYPYYHFTLSAAGRAALAEN
jgi:hypothetical protein